MVKRILALSLLMVGLMGLSGCGDGMGGGAPESELNTTSDILGVFTLGLSVNDTCKTQWCICGNGYWEHTISYGNLCAMPTCNYNIVTGAYSCTI